MQITEKTRSEIALSLPKLGFEECTRIAKECGCSIDTVYREWRKIRGTQKGAIDMEHPVVLALAELAIVRRKEIKATKKRLSKVMKQLSAA